MSASEGKVIYTYERRQLDTRTQSFREWYKKHVGIFFTG